MDAVDTKELSYMPLNTDPVLTLAESILRLGQAIHELQATQERSERERQGRIEDKLDRLAKDFATLQEDKAKMQKLFELVEAQQERLKKLSA